jgi:hypothetical protein
MLAQIAIGRTLATEALPIVPAFLEMLGGFHFPRLW